MHIIPFSVKLEMNYLISFALQSVMEQRNNAAKNEISFKRGDMRKWRYSVQKRI